MDGSEEEEGTLEPGVDAVVIAADAQSILDRATKRRDEQEDYQIFDIPTWEGDLKAKYKIVDRGELEKMVQRIRKRSRGSSNGSNSGVEADADFLIKACIGIIAYDADADFEVTISPGYTMELASMFKPVWPKGHPLEGETFAIKTTRELVIYLFKWNGIALATHGAKVARWMQDPTRLAEDPT
jgi:hypothetical protein